MLSDVAFLLGWPSFALVIGYLALANLLDLESSVGYAKSKGAPLASLTVPLGSLGLVAGARAVLLGGTLVFLALSTTWPLVAGIGL